MCTNQKPGAELDVVGRLGRVEAVGEHVRAAAQEGVAGEEVVGDRPVDRGHGRRPAQAPRLEAAVRRAVHRRRVVAELVRRPRVAVVGEPGHAAASREDRGDDVDAGPRRAREDGVEGRAAGRRAPFGEEPPPEPDRAGDPRRERVGDEEPAGWRACSCGRRAAAARGRGPAPVPPGPRAARAPVPPPAPSARPAPSRAPAGGAEKRTTRVVPALAMGGKGLATTSRRFMASTSLTQRVASLGHVQLGARLELGLFVLGGEVVLAQGLRPRARRPRRRPARGRAPSARAAAPPPGADAPSRRA